MTASGFLTKLDENKCEENPFSLEFFLRTFLRNNLLIFAAAFLKITPLQVFRSFYIWKQRCIRTQSNITMEPIAKKFNGFKDLFRTKWNI